MKITLKDFGPISHFEFDLEKDMHVIFGKNSTGKSNAITIVYLIIKTALNWGDKSYGSIERLVFNDATFGVDSQKSTSQIATETIGRFSKKYNSKISATIKRVAEKIEKEPESLLNEQCEPLLEYILEKTYLQELENSLKNSFPSIGSLSNLYGDDKMVITVDTKGFQLNITINDTSLQITSVKIKDAVIAASEIDKQKEPRIIYNSAKPTDISLFTILLYYHFCADVLDSVNRVYFLPSSRSGLYQALSTFSSVMVELSKSRNFLTKKVELPNISEPISDYFLYLSSINSNVSSNAYNDIIAKLEAEILNGEVLFNDENKRVFFRQKDIGVDFDLSYTSSMVSEIAPIVAFIKFIVGTSNNKDDDEGGLLFIEEPEAHLHPEVQVKLMEMFALLAGNRVKIVMTSHSNYMFNKLSNLLLEGKIDHSKVSSYLMRMTDKGSVTDMLSMKAEADGMNDENFADVAEMLYEERIKIYDKLNNAENAD